MVVGAREWRARKWGDHGSGGQGSWGTTGLFIPEKIQGIAG